MKTKHTTQAVVWDKETGSYIKIPINIVINYDKIAFNMGPKAHRSKRGKSQAMRGAIVVTKV